MMKKRRADEIVVSVRQNASAFERSVAMKSSVKSDVCVDGSVKSVTLEKSSH